MLHGLLVGQWIETGKSRELAVQTPNTKHSRKMFQAVQLA